MNKKCVFFSSKSDADYRPRVAWMLDVWVVLHILSRNFPELYKCCAINANLTIILTASFYIWSPKIYHRHMNNHFSQKQIDEYLDLKNLEVVPCKITWTLLSFENRHQNVLFWLKFKFYFQPTNFKEFWIWMHAPKTDCLRNRAYIF